MGKNKVWHFFSLLGKPNQYPYHTITISSRVLSTRSSSPAYRTKAPAKPAKPTKACAATVTMGIAPADEEAEDALAEAEDAPEEATEAADDAADEADAATDDAALAAEDATLDAEAFTDEATLEAEADLDEATEALDELALPAAAVIEL
jgi:hypothetical protein